MFNLDDITNEKNGDDNEKSSYNPDHPYRMLIIGGSGSEHLNDLKAFVEYSNTMDDVYNNINDYNPNRNRKILIAFHDTIVDSRTNKKLQIIIKNYVLDVES